MNETKKSAAGRLFYTFGTILLIAIITVCAINFAKDGRAFEMPLLSAVTNAFAHTTTEGAIKNTDGYNTIKYKKPDAKATSNSNSSKGDKSSGATTVTSSTKAQPPVVNP